MKRTPWFSGDVKPARPGVYEREYLFAGVKFCLWSGREWKRPAETAAVAGTNRRRSFQQELYWRGLTKKQR